MVVWSQGSVGVEGAFVRDEAGRAMANGILVPVMIDKVAPPLGFGELQAIDLTGWRGNPRDPFFQDLVAVIRAKLDHGADAAAEGADAARVRAASALRRHLQRRGSPRSPLFGFNTFGVASNVCTLPGAAAGALGLLRRLPDRASGRAARSGWPGRRARRAAARRCATTSPASRKAPIAARPPTC